MLFRSIAWYRRQRAQNKGVTLANLAWVAAGFVVLAIAMQFISFKGISIPAAPPPAVVETIVADLPPVEQTQVAAIPTPTGELVVYAPVFVDTPTSTVETTPTPVVEIPSTETPIVETPTGALVITDTPIPFLQPYYTEEFDGDIANWFEFMSSGDARMVGKRLELGQLSIDLLPMDDKLPWLYLINNSFAYSNVKAETLVVNRSVNATGVSVICRYGDIGWYEFVFSNTGVYSIYAVDNSGLVSQGYNLLTSTMISPDSSANVFAAECKGSELNQYVNNTLVNTFVDTKFNFIEGKVGIAVSSPDKLPVSVGFDYVKVSEP